MITTAIAVSTDGAVNLGAGPTFGILLAILFLHGIVCSAATQILARLNLFYVIVNGMKFLLTRVHGFLTLLTVLSWHQCRRHHCLIGLRRG